jgi:predicted DNA-binding transcriptional regulator YafY
MARGDVLFRQWELIRTLQSYRFGVSIDELAERIECNRRTIQRDLAALQDIFPIQYELGHRGKKVWKLDSKAITSDQLELTLTETLSLFLSQQLLLPLAGTQFGDGLDSALKKIRALLPARALNYFEDLDETLLVKYLGQHDYSDQTEDLRLINEAIRTESALRIHYLRSEAGKKMISEFHPYGLMLYQASLYCVGYLVKSEAVRSLKITRIDQVNRLKKQFTRPDDFSLAKFAKNSFGVFNSGDQTKIKALFTGWAARSVRETMWHSSQKIVRDSKGTVTATFEVTGIVEFKRWALGFGRLCQVLRPDSLASELQDEFAAALENYAGDS